MTAQTPLPPRPLRVSGLSVARDGRTLFSGLDFAVDPGGVLLVRGPNGAGKSSLLLTLAGLLRPESGRIEIGAEDENPGTAMHFLGHLNAVKPRLTLAENLRFWMDLQGEAPSPLRGRRWREAPDEGGPQSAQSLSSQQEPRPPLIRPSGTFSHGGEKGVPTEPETAIADALTAVGLPALDHHDAGHLSQGQTRRLALARLVAIPRPIWLLDEPTAALDTSGEALVARLVRDHRALGGIAVIATHHDLDVGPVETLTLGAA